MHTLDLSTLFVVTVFVAALLGLGLVLMWLRDRDNPVLAWWGGSIFLSNIAFAAFTLRGTLSEFWTIDVACGGVLGALALAWGGVRYFEGRRIAVPALALPLVPWAVAVALVPGFARDYDLRVPLFSLVMVTYTLLVTREIWISRAERLRSRPLIVALLLAHAAWFALRGILSVTGWVPSEALAEGYQWLALASFERLVLGLGTAFLALSLVKEREELQDRTAARVDPLTGAGNRRAFAEAIAAISAREDAATMPVALLLFDLDSFKAINDTWGHSFGDRVLRLFSESTRRQLRASDLFSRLGGEEFAAVLVGISRAEALAVAERIRGGFAGEAAVIDGRKAAVTVSVGLATRSRVPARFDEMFDDADRALYLAKAAGRDRVRLAREPDLPGTLVAVA
ncbi:MAG TPA: GGDEF domain-containing protein [Hyphomicrobiales bacterium]|nr:GGDEF domain-containing protein [Hyphomicrobiales bacterium]